MTGTHKGSMSLPTGDLPASNKKVNVPSCDVIRTKGNKIQSINCYFAATVLLEQVGEMPSHQVA